MDYLLPPKYIKKYKEKYIQDIKEDTSISSMDKEYKSEEYMQMRKEKI